MRDNASEPRYEDLAGEYVLGTLTGSARAAFERRLLEDIDLQQEVEAWENRFSPLLDTIEPVTPPAKLWQQLEKRLDPQLTKDRDEVRLWNNLNFWRGLSAVAATLVLALSLSMFGLIQRDGALERVMVVTNDRAQAGWIVGAHTHSPMLRVRAVEPTPLPAGKVCQLWLETESGVLLPVGILPHRGITEMAMPMGISPSGRFKVSIESAAKAPVAQPTAEFVFEGRLTSI